ncbi:YjbH domain-containing protein [Albibacillus kandeliae]|uniref:YjbH domain-containing protein n=1 Tax=Albibacillus kandeliae TaxID=2174228 RepID=UPI001E4DFA3B|nr:YjbH domain-containing protein [Albibacillus kandeliae]
MTERDPAISARTALAALGLALALALPLPLAAEDILLSAPGSQEPSFDPAPPPSLNFYGSPGLIDMPSAEMLPDAQFTTAFSSFGGQGRLTTTFQALPWLSASFRYNGIRDWNYGGFDTYYDRGFDVRVRLLSEGRYRPAVAVGLQDFVGTGIYAGEYIVATKGFDTPALSPGRLPGRLKLSAGVGWGRLGTNNSFGAPFGNDRPAYDPESTGGKVAYDQWFRGPAAFFGGLEWQADERWSVKAEYSSDAYNFETGVTSVFERKSDFNFGVEWQASESTRLGAYYLYGSRFGLAANIQVNPSRPPNRIAAPAPQPVAVRVPKVDNPLSWSEDWAGPAGAAAASQAAGQGAGQAAANRQLLRDLLQTRLSEQGLELESISLSADRAELRYRNTRYSSNAIAVGRAARVLAATLPNSVETFRLVPVRRGLALSAVTLRRSDLEALEFAPDASRALYAVTAIGEAAPLPPAGALGPVGSYPSYRWSLGPYFDPSYFDPDRPFRLDFGLSLSMTYEFAPGWLVSGNIRQRIAGNVKDGRPSNSVLPHVRTDQTAYAQEDTVLNRLYMARQWRPGGALYARVTGGYLEKMFGGVSAELLWKPVNSRLGLGVEANYVRQRDFDQRFGFQDYSVFTGHASAYLELGNGYLAEIDAGRYLAGDVGATVSLDRTFSNGWSVGGWFTVTDVSAEDFGEGSFDKGIRFTIPVNWFLGKPTQQAINFGIRPTQRDGGQRLNVPGRLYEQVRDSHAKALSDQWPRIWE